jgi:quaternary ammonium compound-resistance protein SugE
MAWTVLIIAGILEVVWAFTMKQSAGFTRLGPSLITVAAMIASVALLSFAMRSLPLGTAYAVWTGIGAVGAFIVGIAVLGEAASALRLGSFALILIGLVGLKLA